MSSTMVYLLTGQRISAVRGRYHQAMDSVELVVAAKDRRQLDEETLDVLVGNL